MCQNPREVERLVLSCEQEIIMTVVTSRGDGFSIMTSNLSGDLVAY